MNVSNVKILGDDELFSADVVEEDGVKKLVVKSTIVPQVLGNRFTRFALNGASKDLAVNGGGTPVEFFILADPLKNLIVSSLIFEAFASGIKLDKFLSMNSDLTNGVEIEVKSSDVIFTFEPIRNTIEFDSLFANGAGRSFEIINASGNDSMVTRFGPTAPFLIEKQGTFGVGNDDYIKIIIQDNLSSISSFRFLAEGSLR